MVNVRHYRSAQASRNNARRASAGDVSKAVAALSQGAPRCGEFSAELFLDPYPDKMVQTVGRISGSADQRRWVWFVQQGVWSFVPALYKAVTGNEVHAPALVQGCVSTLGP